MTHRFWMCIIAATMLAVAGCGAIRMAPPQEPAVRVVRGPDVPVPVPCEPKLTGADGKSLKPDFVDKDDALAAIPDPETGANLYRAAILQYRFWINVLEGAIAGCRTTPQ